MTFPFIFANFIVRYSHIHKKALLSSDKKMFKNELIHPYYTIFYNFMFKVSVM